MGYLIDGYKIMGKEISQYAVRHRAGIGTVVSVAGTILSNVLSTKAGAKSARQIDAEQMRLGRVLTTKEKVKLCWSNHIGSVLTAGASCVGAGYSHNQHVKDFNKVATAYAGVKKLYDAGRQATKEVLGEKKNAELQDKLNQKEIADNPELKKKINSVNENPDPSTMRKFWEPVSGEILYSTVDKIELVIKMMNAEMAALKPRDPSNQFCCSGEYGIRLRRFFELGNWELPRGKDLTEVMIHYGWNKGREKNGTDDEAIAAYFTPMIIDEDTMETCAAINWDTRPSDMRYGDYMKA